MDVNPQYWTRRENGSVELIELPRAAWVSTRTNNLVGNQHLCRWRPPYQLTEDLPTWYDLGLVSLQLEDGRRRFVPVDHVVAGSEYGSPGLRITAGSLEHVASLAGHAILADRGEIRAENPLTYDEARLFVQYVCHMREHFGPTTQLRQALRVCYGGRADRGSTDSLPAGLGLDMSGSQLRKAGLESAQAAGHQNPSPEHVLRFGLLEAARRSPIDIRDDESLNLVRLALFDVGPTIDGTSPEQTRNVSNGSQQTSGGFHREVVMAYVARHVKESLKDHRHDTTDEFDRWIADRKSNLIHRISKRKDCRWTREQVRAGLLALGWEAFQMLGQCIDAQFRAFRAALPFELDADEHTLFAHVYLGDPALGGLPLLMLRSRFDFLREAILETWNNPGDRHAIAVLHTMMHYYSELATTRRATDRQYKRRAQHRTAEGRVSREESLDHASSVASRAKGDNSNRNRRPHADSASSDPLSDAESRLLGQFRDLVDHFRELRGIECTHGCLTWGHELTEDGQSVTIALDCECGRMSTQVRMERTEFIQVARDFLDAWPQ